MVGFGICMPLHWNMRESRNTAGGRLLGPFCHSGSGGSICGVCEPAKLDGLR